MSYSTGTATDAPDLLSKFYDFAGTAGWTKVALDATGEGDSGQYTIRHVASGMYVHLVAFDNFGVWDMQPSTGYTSMNDFDDHPGTASNDGDQSNYLRMASLVPGGTGGDNGGNWQNYHFFGTADYLYMFMEYDAGRWRSCMMGMPTNMIDDYEDADIGFFITCTTRGAGGVDSDWLIPFDGEGASDDGGQWVKVPPVGLCPYTYHLPADGRGGNSGSGPNDGWCDVIGVNFHNWASTGAPPMQTPFYIGGRHSLSARPQLAPIPIIMASEQVDSGTYNPATDAWTYLGQAEDLYFVSMDGYDGGDTFDIGSDTYLIFPLFEKSEPATFPFRLDQPSAGLSGLHGFAVKQVV